jgi:hypothetical protein
MPLRMSWKYMYALDLAAGLGFEWDYEDADEYDLYEAIEIIGYSWDGEGWSLPQAPIVNKPAPKPRRKRANVLEQLEAWKSGKPIK